MGGSSSKKRSKSKIGTSSIGQISTQLFRESYSGNSSGQARALQHVPDLETSSNSITHYNVLDSLPRLDADDWLLELDARERMENFSTPSTSLSNVSHEENLQYSNLPPPYSEVDPLGSAGGYNIDNKRFASIPNLMDIDPNDIESAFRDSSSSEQHSRENLSDFQTCSNAKWQNQKQHEMLRSVSQDDLLASNSSFVPEFESKIFKSKINRKKNNNGHFQKPDNIAKKSNFQSNPDIFASSSQFETSSQEPRKCNGRFQQQKQQCNGNANWRKNKVITPAQLIVLSNKSDQEIMFRVQNFSTGFVNLLYETEYSDAVLILVMDILAKVCKNDDYPHTANALLQTVLYTNIFNVRMVKYLQTAPYDGSMDENPTLLQNLLVVFTTVLREFKKEAEQKLGNCLALGRQAITQLIGPSGDLDDELIQKLRCLTDVQKRITCKSPVIGFPAVFNINYDLPLAIESPKTTTDYKHHLLNLLHKEFINTLKMKPGETVPALYRNVHLIGTDCTCKEGLIYKLNFQTNDHEVSCNDIKLLEGSTVFLSLNLEEELHCAVVIRRCPEELSKGQVWIKLQDGKSSILQYGKPYIMIENFTYKDDFISLMEALQLQLETPLPFTSHILGMKKKLSHPTYLDSKSFFSFPYLSGKGKDAKKQYCALNSNTWPSAKSFGFEEPFHEAFKHALTKELALIQSSSASQAIRFGVCVLKALLNNKEVWNSSQTPITVFFYSDESLDCFLRTVLDESKNEKIIRMGGNCQDAILKNYDLDEARRIVYNTGDFPPYVMQNRRVLNDKLCKLKSEIANKMDLLENSRVHILKSEVLKGYIAKNHWMQLMSQISNNDSDPMLQWLSSYTTHELQSLQIELFDKLSEAPKEFKTKPVKKTRIQKKSDKKCGSMLSQIEIKRRVALFPSAQFDDSEKSFNHKSPLLSVDNALVTQNQIKKEPLCHLKGKQFGLFDIIKLELERKDVTSDSEVNDLLLLGARDRWRLYRYWFSKFEKYISNEVGKLQKKFEKCFLQMQEVIREIDVSILKRATVTGLTIASAAKHHRLLKIVAPRIIIVEDAGQLAEANLLASLTEQCCHLIFIGDYHRLRPAINGFRSSDNAIRPRTMSLFEILIDKGIKYIPLFDSHLMSSSLQNVFKTLFVDLPIIPNVALAPPNPTVRGMASDIFFINNSCPESVNYSLSLYTNEYEANYLVLLSKYLVSQGYAQSQITILTTGIGQVQLLLKLSEQNKLNQITCASVEDYQGKSNDLVLLSLVRSNDLGDVGPMADNNYMSVAMTRARLGLYCIGNFKMLVDSLDNWKSHITFMASQQLYGSTLTLKCDWHPTQTFNVDSLDGLKSAINGKCKQPCHVVMSCGHKCVKKCHAEDRDHKNVKCGLPCGKVVCASGHTCLQKCFEKCSPCQMSFKKVQSCGHEAVVKCSDLSRKTHCTENCKKILACGHNCPKKCGEKCDDLACTVMNEYHNSPCKHVFFISCVQKQMNKLERLCPMPCTETLLCGHTCTGTCGECQQSKMHIPCKAKCECFLICGHMCQELCGSNCLPCKDSCGNRCDHAKCLSGCGSPCVPCLEPCTYKCAHQKCSKMCFEICNRTACNYPCSRLLPCKHPCIGFCGEPCPPLCRVCDLARILEGMPGSKQIGTARFVLLEDCGHVVEVISMNKIMQGNGTVEIKTCPMCDTAIRKNLRYGNIIKRTQFDIAKITHQWKEGDSGLSMSLKDFRNTIKGLPETIFPDAVKQFKVEVQQNLSCQEALVLENKYHFLQYMLTLWQENIRLASGQDRMKGHELLLNLGETHMTLNIASGQRSLDAFVRELKRVLYLIHVFRFFKDHPVMKANDKMLYNYLRNFLIETKTFSAAAENMTVKQMKRLYSACDMQNALVEDPGNVRVSDVMQMTAGHWKKCKKGHLFFFRQNSEDQQVQCKTCTRVVGQ